MVGRLAGEMDTGNVHRGEAVPLHGGERHREALPLNCLLRVLPNVALRSQGDMFFSMDEMVRTCGIGCASVRSVCGCVVVACSLVWVVEVVEFMIESP